VGVGLFVGGIIDITDDITAVRVIEDTRRPVIRC
jgi:hypothetical protein